MKCEEYELMISSLVDGEEGTARSAELFVHLANCTGCQRFFRYLLKLRNAEADPITEGSLPAVASARADHLRARERDITDRPPHGILRRQISMSVPTAAIALVMLVLWTVAFSFTIMRGEGSGVGIERDQFQRPSMQTVVMQSTPDESSPNSH
jgi:hypothetical protein